MMSRNDSPSTDDVAAWLQELARTPLDAPPLADPSLLWWKGQLLRRLDTERRAVEPIEVGERVQVAIGSAGALLLLIWLWRVLSTSDAPWLTPVIVITGILLATTAVLTSWDRSRSHL